MSLARACLLAAAAALSGCTYTATAQRVDDEAPEERIGRIVDVLDETPTGPFTATVTPGPVPDSVQLSLRAPLRSRCRVLLARRDATVLREAEVTYVPRRSLLKHGLAFTVGWAILAPVWLPLHYHGCADDEAEAALERDPGVSTRQDEGGGCFVIRVDRGAEWAEWTEDGTESERDVAREGPLRGAPVLVQAKGKAAFWSGRTDALGRVVVLRRALGLPASGEAALTITAAGTSVVVTTNAWSPPGPDGAPAHVEEQVARDGIEVVVRQLAVAVGSGAIATDAPAARALPGLLRRRGGPIPLDDAARPHVEAAVKLLRELRHEEATTREHLAAALRASPGCWEVHRLLGAAARLEGDEPVAARHLQIALCLLPETSPLAAKIAGELAPR